MGLLKKLFGGGDPLSAARRAAAQQRWADALVLAESVAKEGLGEADCAELETLLQQAGDQLAELNLGEGEACLRGGDLQRAAEHFTLARQQARTAVLERRAATLLTSLQASPSATPAPTAAKSCCPSGCQGDAAELTAVGDPWDLEVRFELAMASYAPEWRSRYEAACLPFKEALLLAHEGAAVEAKARFATIPDGERDDLYHFELGALLARMGETAEARQQLERSVALNPRQILALETLVGLDFAEANLASAENRLLAMLDQSMAAGYCYSRLASIRAAQGDETAALDYGSKALAAGTVEVEALLLQSSLLEKQGRLDEAEAVLAVLPSGGCGGGAHPLLAEFWLRHQRSLKRALEAFKAAARQEPSNPRWLLRMAHTYLAMGWLKDGEMLIQQILTGSAMDEPLRNEAQRILSLYGK